MAGVIAFLKKHLVCRFKGHAGVATGRTLKVPGFRPIPEWACVRCRTTGVEETPESRRAVQIAQRRAVKRKSWDSALH